MTKPKRRKKKVWIGWITRDDLFHLKEDIKRAVTDEILYRTDKKIRITVEEIS